MISRILQQLVSFKPYSLTLTSALVTCITAIRYSRVSNFVRLVRHSDVLDILWVSSSWTFYTAIRVLLVKQCTMRKIFLSHLVFADLLIVEVRGKETPHITKSLYLKMRECIKAIFLKIIPNHLDINWREMWQNWRVKTVLKRCGSSTQFNWRHLSSDWHIRVLSYHQNFGLFCRSVIWIGPIRDMKIYYQTQTTKPILFISEKQQWIESKMCSIILRSVINPHVINPQPNGWGECRVI